jgi:hypothetical protein
VTQYLVVGPFPLEYGGDETAPAPAGFLREYPPEKGGAAGEPYASVDGPARWRQAATLVSGLLDLRKLFRTTDNVVAYAHATVVAPRDMEVTLGIGSNDAPRVWLNGDLVFSWWGGRGARQNENQVRVHLRKGPNALLAKVANLGLDWQLYLAFKDPARELTFGVD